MNVPTSSPTRADTVRACAVVVAGVLQIAGGIVGGMGLLGESVSSVANSYPTVLQPGGAAFSIWSLIYAVFLVLAVRQVLPRQRARTVHRRSGWWLVAAGVLNAAWIVLFTQRQFVLAQLAIVALLLSLAFAADKVRAPGGGWADRLLLRLPITLYLGWVAIATVAGAGTTLAAVATAPSPTLAVAALVVTAVLVIAGVLWLPAIVGFAVAVCWAFAWIAVATTDTGVAAVSLAAIAGVVLAVVIRTARTKNRGTVLFG